MAQAEQRRLEVLLARLIDDQLTGEEIAELESMLLVDPLARAQYRAIVKVNALLSARMHRPESARLPQGLEEAFLSDSSISRQASRVRLREKSPSPLSVGYWRARPLRFSGIALALTLLLWAGFTYVVLPRLAPHDSVSPGQDFIAKMSDERGAVWAEGAKELAVGDTLEVGQAVELTDGFVEVTFGRGAVVLVEAPAHFVIDSRGAGTLKSGRVVARVERPGEGKVGFSISTPLALIIDLGTEFGVEVVNDGATTVEVFEGLVEATPSGGDPRQRLQPLRLREGQSVRLEPDSQAFDLREPHPGQFAQKMPEEGLQVLTPISVSDTPHNADFLIDGSGLDASGSIRNWTHSHPGATGTSWSNAVSELPLELTFDLGAEFDVKMLWVWNFSFPDEFIYRNRSAQHVRVEVSADGQSFEPRGEITLAATESHPNRGQRFALVGRMRYVRLIVLDSYHDKSRPDYQSSEIGIGEVRFEGMLRDTSQPTLTTNTVN